MVASRKRFSAIFIITLAARYKENVKKVQKLKVAVASMFKYVTRIGWITVILRPLGTQI